MQNDAGCCPARSMMAHVDLPSGRKYVALNHASGPASPWGRGPELRNRTGIKAAPPGPAGSCSPPAGDSQHDGRHDHERHSEDDCETSLNAYITRLVDAAPPLSSQQRDTLALLLRLPRRR